MRSAAQIDLPARERNALDLLLPILRVHPDVSRVILFGSKSRGDSDPESDVDLLLLTRRPLSRSERAALIDSLYQTQLLHAVVLSPLIVSEEEWRGGTWRLVPIHAEIERDGIDL